jgi:hypothetical protein
VPAFVAGAGGDNGDDAVITVRMDGLAEVKRRLAHAPGQIAFATALALTRTASRVRQAEYRTMRQVFDRPTPYTMGALSFEKATKQKQVATVWFKGRDSAGKGTAAERYLLPQVYGGSRPDKRSEGLLRAAGYLPPGMQAVPASGAPLDRYGNLQRGYLQRLLSNLRAQRDATANVTQSRRSRAGARKVQVFVSRGDRLPRGVWERFGRRVVPVLLFTGPHRYTARFPFFEVGKREAERWLPIEARRAVRDALRTARTDRLQ